MRPIDADALEDVVQRINDDCGGITRNDFKMLDSVVFLFPTIDAVPVVRCKKCKWWQQATPNSGNCGMGFAPTAYADDYCSFGERREDAGADEHI